MNEQSTQLKKHLGQLFMRSLSLSAPLHQLEQIRQKLEGRGLQNFDREDIMAELGSMQQTLGVLHGEMLRISELLKKQN